MLTQTGEVVAWQEGVVRVRIRRFAGCGRCQLRHGCGAGILERALPGRSLELTLPAELPLHPGKQVTIGLREPSMLSAAALVYLVPLLILMIGALALAPFGEAASIAGGVLGLAGGVLAVRAWVPRTGRGIDCEPVLLNNNGNADGQ